MRETHLTTWERMQLVTCVPERGRTNDLRKYMRLLNILDLTPEEKEEVEWTETLVLQDGQPVLNPQTGVPVANITVQKPELVFELSFEDADFDILMELVDARETWAIRGPDGKRTEALLDKLEK